MLAAPPDSGWVDAWLRCSTVLRACTADCLGGGNEELDVPLEVGCMTTDDWVGIEGMVGGGVRLKLFKHINQYPTLFEIVTGRARSRHSVQPKQRKKAEPVGLMRGL